MEKDFCESRVNTNPDGGVVWAEPWMMSVVLLRTLNDHGSD